MKSATALMAAGVMVGAVLFAGCRGPASGTASLEAAQEGGRTGQVPMFEWDPTWPTLPLPTEP